MYIIVQSSIRLESCQQSNDQISKVLRSPTYLVCKFIKSDTSLGDRKTVL